MIRPRLFLAAALLALAACAAQPTAADLDTAQRRAVFGIQAKQKASTAALVAGTISVQQDRDAQARLARARRDVMAATTPAAVTAATDTAGVTP